MKRVLIVLALTVSMLSAGYLSQAADEPKPAAAKTTNGERRKQMPFRGKISAVDPTARTVTLAGREKARVFHVTEESRLNKDGKVITLEELKPGESVGGLARSRGADEWEVLTLNAGTKAVKAKAGEKVNSAPME